MVSCCSRLHAEEEKRRKSDDCAWGETVGCISVYGSTLTICEGSSKFNMNVNLALWLQVHLQKHKHTIRPLHTQNGPAETVHIPAGMWWPISYETQTDILQKKCYDIAEILHIFISSEIISETYGFVSALVTICEFLKRPCEIVSAICASVLPLWWLMYLHNMFAFFSVYVMSEEFG